MRVWVGDFDLESATSPSLVSIHTLVLVSLSAVVPLR